MTFFQALGLRDPRHPNSPAHKAAPNQPSAVQLHAKFHPPDFSGDCRLCVPLTRVRRKLSFCGDYVQMFLLQIPSVRKPAATVVFGFFPPHQRSTTDTHTQRRKLINFGAPHSKSAVGVRRFFCFFYVHQNLRGRAHCTQKPVLRRKTFCSALIVLALSDLQRSLSVRL